MQKRPVISKLIIFIIVIAILLRLPLFFKNPYVWWDSAVYIGMAKYIWSSGMIGIWESQRPLLFPLLLGFFWKLGLPIVLVGKLLELLFSVGCILLVYLIGIKIGNKVIGHVAALFFVFDPVFFKFMPHILLTIPALFFALCGLYCYLMYNFDNQSKKMLFLSGIFLALSFLTRFMFVLFFFGILLDYLLRVISYHKQKKKFKQLFSSFFQFIFAFFLTTLPYLIFNAIQYGNFLFPLMKKLAHMQASSLFEISKGSFYYFTHIPNLSPILLFVVFGLVFMIMHYKIRNSVNVLHYILALSLLFFTFFSIQEERYALVFLPLGYIISIYGITSFFKKKKIRKYAVFIILLSFIIPLGEINKTKTYLPMESSWEESHFYNYFQDIKFNGMIVASTSPLPVYFSDVKIAPLYVGYKGSMSGYLDYLTVTENISYFQFIYEEIACSSYPTPENSEKSPISSCE